MNRGCGDYRGYFASLRPGSRFPTRDRACYTVWIYVTCTSMKTFAAVVTLAAVTGLSIHAQEAKPAAPAKQTIPERVKMLAASLGLKQDQQDKIRKIMEEDEPKFAALQAMPKEDRKGKFRPIMQAQHEKIEGVLTAEQRERYKAAVAGNVVIPTKTAGESKEKEKKQASAEEAEKK